VATSSAMSQGRAKEPGREPVESVVGTDAGRAGDGACLARAEGRVVFTRGTIRDYDNEREQAPPACVRPLARVVLVTL